MSSLRKKYLIIIIGIRLQCRQHPSAAPLEPPPPADDAPQLPEKPGTERDPVREAEQSAIKQQLAEMERAEQLAGEAVTQQPRYATEPQQQRAAPTPEEIIANSGLPDRVQRWNRANPQFLTDP